ncbi:hypothetical protein L596_008301 [Steinernema carpocapsae]|uniref:Uncharacterized protein n=1 Tax=Steinernema carpocapsae TaxID=34508 RepID=A0A4U5PCL1_STECR|nr:hypothetical protein L596_008301 [Steinernema carpocapsae]
MWPVRIKLFVSIFQVFCYRDPRDPRCVQVQPQQGVRIEPRRKADLCRRAVPAVAHSEHDRGPDASLHLRVPLPRVRPGTGLLRAHHQPPPERAQPLHAFVWQLRLRLRQPPGGGVPLRSARVLLLPDPPPRPLHIRLPLAFRRRVLVGHRQFH